jgi:hypothetical protein
LLRVKKEVLMTEKSLGNSCRRVVPALAAVLLLAGAQPGFAAERGWNWILSIKQGAKAHADGRVTYRPLGKCYTASVRRRIANQVGLGPAKLILTGNACVDGKARQPFSDVVALVPNNLVTKTFQATQYPSVINVSVRLCAKINPKGGAAGDFCVRPNPRKPTDGGIPDNFQ